MVIINEGGGIRTRDLRIKSPLLCLLSYALGPLGHVMLRVSEEQVNLPDIRFIRAVPRQGEVVQKR